MKHSFLKKTFAYFTAFSILSNGSLIFSFAQNNQNVKSYDIYYETAEMAVKNIKLGWNLGNTLDSHGMEPDGTSWIKKWTAGEVSDFETAWGNPVTTREIISAVKNAGFNAVRIPVTYAEHIDENYNIDSEWLDRVEEVLNYALDEGLYCITNIHHDTGTGTNEYSINATGWLRASPEKYETMLPKYRKVWEQLSERFKKYNEKLLFEGFNEILDDNNDWSNPSYESLEVVNKLNQVFVDTVRASGGNNISRNLVLTTYAASSESKIINAFSVPADSVQNHLIAEIHSYEPSAFCWEAPSWLPQNEWTSNWDGSLTPQIEDIMQRINTVFNGKGIPVIIGEFGAVSKNTNNGTVNSDELAKFYAEYVEIAANYGIPCFAWDVNQDKLENFSIIDRVNLKPFYPEVTSAMTAALKIDISGDGDNFAFDKNTFFVYNNNDINFDGKANVGDLIWLKRSIAKWENYPVSDYCDYDKNNIVDTPDLIVYKKALIKKFSDFDFEYVPVVKNKNGNLILNIDDLTKLLKDVSISDYIYKFPSLANITEHNISSFNNGDSVFKLLQKIGYPYVLAINEGTLENCDLKYLHIQNDGTSAVVEFKIQNSVITSKSNF